MEHTGRKRMSPLKKGLLITGGVIGGFFFWMMLFALLLVRPLSRIESSAPTRTTPQTPPRTVQQPEPVTFESQVEKKVDRLVPGPVTVKIDSGVVNILYANKSAWDATDLVWDLARKTCKICPALFEHPEVQRVCVSVTTTFTDKYAKESEELGATLVFGRATAAKVGWKNMERKILSPENYDLLFDIADDYYIHPAVVKELVAEQK